MHTRRDSEEGYMDTYQIRIGCIGNGTALLKRAIVSP